MIDQEKLELPVSWGWLLALGIALLIFGILGVAMQFYLTLASVILFGALALVSGCFQLWHGLATKEVKWSGRALHLLVALIYIVFGGLLVWDPVSGTLSLTLILAGFLIAIGLSRISYAWNCRKRGWKWQLTLVGGLIDLLLAGMIIYGWPETAFWVIGLFVAIEMIINGWLLIAMAMAARNISHEAEKKAST
ncbi:HdeD family acid-resistance protein [Nitrosomonas communis]|uniref:Uncharacterized membrane protein HdeD, DUF308 family n=1 Tax=Nitrosomonas communis TaxID=44574 RepID=A0A1H2ZK68_9PROT|nr:DUF308 domain-containing protein [Nitrosomonas communis]SDX17775.1 Uncharacterized membrane protein HdeD, DUF308 family [Nitrosomonas communis]